MAARRGLRGAVTAAADLFDEDTAHAIAVRLGRVLAAVAAARGPGCTRSPC